MRTIIKILQKQIVPDGIGGVTETWVEFARVFGFQSVRRAWERYTADQQSSSLNVNWETRFVNGVSPDMRLDIAGHLYEILGVYDPSQKGERLMIVSRELQNRGVNYATADSSGEGNEGPDTGDGQLPQEGGSGSEENDDSGLHGDGSGS